MATLQLLIEICLFRGKTQDLPASINLVALAAIASILVDSISFPGREFEFRHLLFAVLQSGLFGAGLWLILKLRKFPARWIQTATALYAINAFFSVLVLPLTPALQEMAKADAQLVFGWQALVAVLLSGWFLAVMAQVLREALEVSLLASFAASLALMIAVFMAGSLLAAFLGLYAES